MIPTWAKIMIKNILIGQILLEKESKYNYYSGINFSKKEKSVKFMPNTGQNPTI